MGQRFLVDTNILIYSFSNEIEKEIDSKLTDLLRKSFNISVITKIEFLGWKDHTPKGYQAALEFLKAATIHTLENNVVERSIEIRRKKTIKLPDAIIAATSLEMNFTLVTRNTKDFSGMKNLKIYNPFNIENG
jgi:toxin FitB